MGKMEGGEGRFGRGILWVVVVVVAEALRVVVVVMVRTGGVSL